MFEDGDGTRKVPRIRLLATRDLERGEEVCWNNMHVMAGPIVQEAAACEPEIVRETHTRPQTNELGKVLAAIQIVNAKVAHRQGTHVLFAY